MRYGVQPCNLNIWEESQELKAIAGCTMSLKSAWATRDCLGGKETPDSKTLMVGPINCHLREYKHKARSFVTAAFRSSVTSHITCQLCFVETWPYLKYYWDNYLNHVNTASQLIKTPRAQETRILIGWQWRVYSTIKAIEFFVWVQAGGRKKSAMRTWTHPITLLLNYKI